MTFVGKAHSLESELNRQYSWYVFLAAVLTLLWRMPELQSYLRNPDSGYQLSLGQQVLLGRFPFVDLFFHYGPLTAFTSGLSQWFHNGVLSEAITNAFGYGVAILLLYRLSPRQPSIVAALLVPFVALLLLSRFYKWYYWLWPLGVLYCHAAYLSARNTGGRWLFSGGVCAAMGALYRLDLAGVFFVFQVIITALEAFAEQDYRRPLKRLGLFLSGFGVPFGIWLLILGVVGGVTSLRDYFAATLTGGAGVVELWGKPLPEFQWDRPLSAASGTALSMLLLPITYLSCLLIGVWQGYLRRDKRHPMARLMAATALIGIGIYPQGFYRPDLAHLLQVMPPMLLAVPYLYWYAKQGLPTLNPPLRKIGQSFLALYGLLLCAAFLGIKQAGGNDMGPLDSDYMRHFSSLRTAPSLPTEEFLRRPNTRILAKLVRGIHEQSKTNEPILVLPLLPQLYYFADRPMSGLLNGYAEGILDGEEWRQRNLETVMAKPPVLLVVNDTFLKTGVDEPFRRSQPELYTYLREHYPRVTYRAGRFMLLGRAQGKPESEKGVQRE